MKVLHVSHTSTVSGAEHSLLTLTAALPRGIVAGIACPPGDLAERASDLGITVYPLPQLQVSLRMDLRHIPASGWELVRCALALRQAARQAQATLLHANSIRAAIVAAGANAVGAPDFIADIRDVLPEGRLPSLLNWLIARRARLIVAVSNYAAARFNGGGHARAAIRVMDNPVDLRRFVGGPEQRAAGRRQLGYDSHQRLLGIVGQITSWRGHDTVIRSLAMLEPRHADVSLLIVGAIKFAEPTTRLNNRGYLGFLQSEITRLGLEKRVVFTGERDDVPAVLSALDVLLVPSTQEPFGRVVAEAMAVGTPVLATSVGGPAEMVKDGVTGRLASPDKPNEWAQGITGLLDDREGARAMADRARLVAQTRFDASRHAQQMMEIYEAASA